jgi:hypothetical protein
MANLWMFVLGLAITILTSALVVTYLRPSLAQLLTDLCGSQERAAFWTAFSTITIGSVPLIFALADVPTTSASPLLQIADQLKWGLIGMVLSVLVLGWVLRGFITRQLPRAEGKS